MTEQQENKREDNPVSATGEQVNKLSTVLMEFSASIRTDAFELRCWRRLLRVPWTARRSKQSILKEISLEYSLEGLMLKLKLQYFGHLMQTADSIGKDPDAGKD